MNVKNNFHKLKAFFKTFICQLFIDDSIEKKLTKKLAYFKKKAMFNIYFSKKIFNNDIIKIFILNPTVFNKEIQKQILQFLSRFSSIEKDTLMNNKTIINYHIPFIRYFKYNLFLNDFFSGRLIYLKGTVISIITNIVNIDKIVNYNKKINLFEEQEHDIFYENRSMLEKPNYFNSENIQLGFSQFSNNSNLVVLYSDDKYKLTSRCFLVDTFIENALIENVIPNDVIMALGFSSVLIYPNKSNIKLFYKLKFMSLKISLEFYRPNRTYIKPRMLGKLFFYNLGNNKYSNCIFESLTIPYWSKILLFLVLIHTKFKILETKHLNFRNFKILIDSNDIFLKNQLLRRLVYYAKNGAFIDKFSFLKSIDLFKFDRLSSNSLFHSMIGCFLLINKGIIIIKNNAFDHMTSRILNEIIEHKKIDFLDNNLLITIKYNFNFILIKNSQDYRNLSHNDIFKNIKCHYVICLDTNNRSSFHLKKLTYLNHSFKLYDRNIIKERKVQSAQTIKKMKGRFCFTIHTNSMNLIKAYYRHVVTNCTIMKFSHRTKTLLKFFYSLLRNFNISLQKYEKSSLGDFIVLLNLSCTTARSKLRRIVIVYDILYSLLITINHL
ncbi:hypothetical protein BNATCHR113 (nucleomorph) [Bigelowiella natans]|uniref:Uncharacterized protein ORF1-606 n=1 Tax=Bigelowiella natans TaxID=227086 RepID=Q3LWK7_BIGNA|nr:hypothetical protein BNATCHR113 [Bigelowiella natans]ABA27160.1 hypothetical protein [Bigelowiella natans]